MSDIKITFSRVEELKGGHGVPTVEVNAKYEIPNEYFEGRKYHQNNDDKTLTLHNSEVDYLSRVMNALNEIGKSITEVMKKERSPIGGLEITIK